MLLRSFMGMGALLLCAVGCASAPVPTILAAHPPAPGKADAVSCPLGVEGAIVEVADAPDGARRGCRCRCGRGDPGLPPPGQCLTHLGTTIAASDARPIVLKEAGQWLVPQADRRDEWSNRSELLAGQSFVEAVALDTVAPRAALMLWLHAHLVQPGRLPAPSVVLERGAGTVVLYARREPHPDSVAPVLRAALERVLEALRGLLALPQDDRFVAAAIHAGRVGRVQQGGITRWAAHPNIADNLSDIVLSLFTVDLLHHRELYDTALSVCDQCGRVGFQVAGRVRNGCAAHFRRSVVAPRSRRAG